MKIIATLLLSYVALSSAIVDYSYNDPQIVDNFDLRGGDYGDKFFKLLDGPKNCWYLRFKVKSDNAVFVQFVPDENENPEKYYEVMIGAWDNKNTCILKQPGKNWLVDKRTPGIISGSWQYFYIRQSHGYWEIGFEYSGEVIATGYDENVLQIEYFRVRSERNSWWKFYLPGLGRRIARQDIHSPGNYVWHFPEFYSKNFYLEFAVKAESGASLVFSPTNSYGDDIYEIIIGAQYNLMCCLRRIKEEKPIIDIPYIDILNKDEFRYFWVSYYDGVLQFGRWADDIPIIEYKDENPLDIRYFGITSYDVKSWWKFYLPCPEPLVVCEDESIDLKCPNGLIVIENALYGRENKPYCFRKDKIKETKGCGDPDLSYQTLVEKCAKKQECTIEVSNDVFGDPCPNTAKYLQLEYSCCYCD